MGIDLSKIRISNRPMISPINMENLDEAGSIYLVIHRPTNQTKDIESNKIGKQVEKTSHFCVAIDITGIYNNFFSYSSFFLSFLQVLLLLMNLLQHTMICVWKVRPTIPPSSNHV
jgi:hypothetical protein